MPGRHARVHPNIFHDDGVIDRFVLLFPGSVSLLNNKHQINPGNAASAHGRQLIELRVNTMSDLVMESISFIFIFGLLGC